MGNLSHTVSGDIASFKSAARVPVTSCKFGFKPKQDLHGYSKPWPAGGGKNLFNCNVPFANPSDTTSANTTLRTFTPNTYCVGTSWSNWFVTTNVFSYVVENNSISIKNTNVYGVGFAFALTAETTYALSATHTSGRASVTFYDSTGATINTDSTDVMNSAFTVPAGCVLTLITFYTIDVGADATGTTFTNIQLEKGSTATSYEPYSNICPIEGWTGLEGCKAGINLCDEEWELGGINLTTGAASQSSTDIRLKHKIPIKGGNKYYLSWDSGSMNIFPVLFHSDGSFSRYAGMRSTIGSHIVTNDDEAYLWLYLYARTTVPNQFQISCGAVFDYEPYCGSKFSVTFPVLGKNKLPLMNSTIVTSVNTGYDATLSRTLVPGTIYQNVSANNYWLGRSNSNYTDNVVDGEITYMCNDPAYGQGLCIEVLPSTQYIVSISENEKVGIRWGFYDIKGNFVDFTGNKKNQAITTPSNAKYAILLFTISDVSYRDQLITVTNAQLEFGSVATSYEPYNPNNAVYGGYVDVAAGEVVATYIHLHLTSSRNWYMYGRQNDNGKYFALETYEPEERCALGAAYLGTAKQNEKYTHGIIDNSWSTVGQNAWVYDSTSYTIIRVGFPDEAGIDTLQKFKDWLDEQQDVYIAYPIANAIHYPISHSQITALLGQNNFYSNTNSITEVSYAIHDTAPIRAAKRRMALNEPHIATATGSIAHFSTDMKAPLKKLEAHFLPVQDLHGYSKPWVGGSGKNLFNVTKLAAETDSWTIDILDLPAGTYTMSSNKGTVADTNIYMYFRITGSSTLSNSNVVYSGHSTTLTIGSGETAEIVYRRASGTNLYSDYTWQIEQGSTATSYEPYENICPISGWTGVNVTACGKNLCNIATVESGFIRAGNTSDEYPLGGKGDNNTWSCSDYIPVVENTIYTITVPDYIGAIAAGLVFYQDTTVASAISGVTTYTQGGTTYTFTTPANCHYLRFSWKNGNGNEAQLELGETKTNYAAYIGSTIPVSWESTAGTIYGGYVDLSKGVLIAEWAKISKPWKDWTLGSELENNIRKTTTGITGINGSTNSICNLTNSYINSNSQDTVHYYINSAGTGIHCIFPKDMDGNTIIEIAYKLKTPIIYQLTPTQLKTLRGINNVWSSANGDTVVQYYKH